MKNFEAIVMEGQQNPSNFDGNIDENIDEKTTKKMGNERYEKWEPEEYIVEAKLCCRICGCIHAIVGNENLQQNLFIMPAAQKRKMSLLGRF